MATIQAIRVHQYGGPEQLRLEQVPRPEPQAGEVLVRVHAAGVNPVDWKIRQGLLKDFAPVQFPLIVEREVRVSIEKVFPLRDAPQAHEQSEAGHGRGCIVLHIAD